MLYANDTNLECLFTTIFRKDVGQQVLVNNVEVIRTKE